MGHPLAITRTEHTAEDLRVLASKSRDGAQVRRLLALAFILDGHTRTEAAERTGMERQTLRLAPVPPKMAELPRQGTAVRAIAGRDEGTGVLIEPRNKRKNAA